MLISQFRYAVPNEPMKKRRRADPLDEAVTVQQNRTGIDLTIRRSVRRGQWEARTLDGSRSWTSAKKSRLMMDLLEYLSAVPDQE